MKRPSKLYRTLIGLSLGAALSFAVVMSALAQAGELPALRLATGGGTGTYYAMGNNMATYCGEGLQLQVQKTGGTDDNIERLTSANKADIAIVQKDILFKRSKINRDQAVSNLLAVMPLYGEAMHLIVKKDSQLQSFTQLGAVPGRLGGYIGGKSGKKVGAYGGSIESAEIVKALSGVDYEIIPVNNIDEALPLLDNGSLDAILAMGGAPLGWVDEKLSRAKHRMIGFDGNTERISGAYRPINVTYTKLGVNALRTIATDAVLVTRNFTSQEKVGAVSLLRKCITTELTKMQEASDTHGQWQNVQKDNLAVDGWSYFAGVNVSWPPTGVQGPRRK